MPQLNIAVDKESWEREFITLPAGEYTGVMELPVQGASAQKKTPMLKLATRIETPTEVTVNGVSKKILGQKIFDELYLTPKGAGFIKKTLKECGISFQLQGENVLFNTDEFAGKRVKVTVGLEAMKDASGQLTGKYRNTVEGYVLA